MANLEPTPAVMHPFGIDDDGVIAGWRRIGSLQAGGGALRAQVDYGAVIGALCV